jgi:iron(III) transport system permease protein
LLKFTNPVQIADKTLINHSLMRAAAILLSLFLSLPIIGLLLPLFWGGGQPLSSAELGEIGDSTLLHLWNYVLTDYVVTTLLLGLGVGIGVFILGVGNAWLVANYQFPGKKLFEWGLILPLAVPAYVMAYLFVDFLQFSGPLQTILRDSFGIHAALPDPRSLGGAIWTFSLCLYPYVYLVARTSFLDRSAHLMEAAETLGFSSVEAFIRLVLPMTRPAIFTGIALALMEVLADFGAVSYFGLQTFATGIFKAWLSFGDRMAAVHLSLMLLTFVLLVFYWEQHNRSRQRYALVNTTSQGVIPKRLQGTHALYASCFCGLTLFFAFVLPMLILLHLLLSEGFTMDPRYFSWLKNSLGLAALTAIVAVICAVFLAYAVRLSQSQTLRSMNRVLTVGYALPGAVLGVGILSLMGLLDVAWFMSVSVGVLVYAYLIRFLSAGLQSIETGLTRITPAMDGTAALLGAKPWEMIRRIHLPLLRRSVLTALLFVFVDVMKELPATLLLRPFNLDTLAVATYQLAADERLAELALPALSIVLVGLLPVILLTRAISKGR